METWFTHLYLQHLQQLQHISQCLLISHVFQIQKTVTSSVFNRFRHCYTSSLVFTFQSLTPTMFGWVHIYSDNTNNLRHWSAPSGDFRSDRIAVKVRSTPWIVRWHTHINFVNVWLLLWILCSAVGWNTSSHCQLVCRTSHINKLTIRLYKILYNIES